MLKFLGRGSAFNAKEGNTSAYYITNENNLLLFDCGSTVFQKIQEKNLLKNINMLIVFVTHTHSDHIGSLSTLIEYCFYTLKRDIEVIYPDKEHIVNILNALGVTPNMYNYHGSVSEYGDNDNEKTFFIQTKHNDQITYLSFEVPHVDHFKSYAYIVYFKENNTVVYYSGDITAENFRNDYMLEALGLIDDGDKNVILYHDTCLADYEGNVHTPLRFLKELIPEDKRKYVYCMHFDKDETILKAKEDGFNVVEVE